MAIAKSITKSIVSILSLSVTRRIQDDILTIWILASGFWDDLGVWDDLDTWNDS